MKISYKTKDYAMFGYYEFNREVRDEANIKAIMAEMKEIGYDEWNPLVVSCSKKIADGQHRLEAAKRLGIEVWVDEYDREFTVEDVIRMNRHKKNWKVSDFVHARVDDENSRRLYGYIKEAELYGIANSIAQTIAMASNGKSYSAKSADKGLTEGEYKIAKEMLFELLSLKSCVPAPTSGNFVRALMKAKENPKFNVATFIKKTQCCPPMRSVKKIYDMVEEIERIYNYNTRQENRIMIDRTGMKR